MARVPPFVVLVLLVAGCGGSTLRATSNFTGSPDGGEVLGAVDCRDVDAGAGNLGTGTAVGAAGFPVMSAHESTNVTTLSGGGSDSFVVQVDFRLDAKPRTCTGFDPSADENAVEAAGTLYGTILVAPGMQLSTGDYGVGSDANTSAGTASLWLDAPSDGGAVQVASSGVVRLTSVEACSFAGVYDVVLSADGGAGPELSGTFAPTYCP